jgi:hypothetical protein
MTTVPLEPAPPRHVCGPHDSGAGLPLQTGRVPPPSEGGTAARA